MRPDSELLGERTTPPAPQRILVVTEDPFFIEEVRDRFRPTGSKVMACLGPSQSPCLMEVSGTCTLAEHSSIVVVDSPRSGVFAGRWGMIPAGTYAEKLSQRHPDSFVILAGAPVGLAGATGEVASVRHRAAALDLISWAVG